MAQKLLLADDSVTIQRVIELTFADEDIHVIAVSDGDEAIARIDADPPDIVLADVGMPGRDGYEVAAHVKGSPRLAHIPVVLLTGAFEPVDQQRAAQVGSDGVLAKPFEPQLVITRVRELLERSRGNGTPVAQAAETAAPVTAEAPAPPAAAPEAAPAGREHLDDYFDRLDAAFASLSSQPPQPAPAASSSLRAAAPDIDWFGSTGAQPGPDLPLSYASPAPQVPSEPAAPATFAAPPLPSLPAAIVPTLGDAFAAILAAEQADPSAPAATWPSAPPEIGDSLVEEVTRRVLERMSDRAVRETVSGIVSTIAERLIREEIERIKSSIK